jgi:hypothetical protein
MRISLLREAAAQVPFAIWRGTNRLAEAVNVRPAWRIAALWWWHNGIGRGSFVAGSVAAVAVVGTDVPGFIQLMLVASMMWLVGLVAEAVHVIAYCDGRDCVACRCPFCADNGDGGHGGHGDGDEEPPACPDDPEDHREPYDSQRCPATFAEFEVQVSAFPAMREPGVWS